MENSSLLLWGYNIFLVFLVIYFFKRSRIKINSQVKFQELSDLEISQISSKTLKEIDANAIKLSFSPYKNFVDEFLKSSKRENRVYLSHDNSTALNVYTNAQLGIIFCFKTYFNDGSELQTNSLSISNFAPDPAWKKIYKFSGIKDLNKLYELHRNNVSERLNQGAVIQPIVRDMFLQEIEQNQTRLLSFWAENGWLKLNKEGDYYSLSPLSYLKHIRNVFSPLGYDFSLKKFFFVIVPAIIAPILLIIFSSFVLPLIPILYNRVGFFILYWISFAVCGIIIGLNWPAKTFIWGFLSGIPATFILPTHGMPIGGAFLSCMIAIDVNSLKQSIKLGTGWKTTFPFVLMTVIVTFCLYILF